MKNINQLYSDRERESKSLEVNKNNRYSKYCDLIYYSSSITPGITLAMIVYKPNKTSYILTNTHGWHMSIPKFEENNDKPHEYFEVPKTGGVDYWTNISDENALKIEKLSEDNRKQHHSQIMLERKGKLIILGYLVTKYFVVFLDNINSVGTISYDIDKGIYEVISKTSYKLTILN